MPATSAARNSLLFFFLLRSFTVLMKQTRQAVRVIKQSIFCLSISMVTTSQSAIILNLLARMANLIGTPYHIKVKILLPENTSWRIRLSTANLLIRVACFLKKIKNVSNIKRLSKVGLLIRVACFVKKKIMFSNNECY